MDHILKHRLRKENCGHEEGQEKRTFQAFEAENVCKLLLSQSSGYRQGTKSAGTVRSISVATYVEKQSLVRDFIQTIFGARQKTVTIINSNPFLQTVLNSARRAAHATLNIKIQSVLKVQIINTVQQW